MVSLDIAFADTSLLGDERLVRRGGGLFAGLAVSLIKVLLQIRDNAGHLTGRLTMALLLLAVLRNLLRKGRLTDALLLLAMLGRLVAATGSFAQTFVLNLLRGLCAAARRARLSFALLCAACLSQRQVVVALASAGRRILLLGDSRQLRATAGIRHAHVSQVNGYTVGQLGIIRLLLARSHLLFARLLLALASLLETIAGLVRNRLAAIVGRRLRDSHARRHLHQRVR